MIKIYFKQACQLIRQHKLYSTVYIIGTGLAIAMTMVIALIYYIKIAPVYPEINRNRMLVVDHLQIELRGGNSMSSSLLSYQFVRDYMYTLETPEAVTAVYKDWDSTYPTVELEDGKTMYPVEVKYVDHNYWKVFAFEFYDGKPFTEADFGSGIKTAVISSSLARTVFGTVQAEGKYMHLDGNSYRISGVVRDVSLATPITCAHIWVPFSVLPKNIQPQDWGEGWLGPYTVYALARSAADTEVVVSEIDEVLQKANQQSESHDISLGGRPDKYWESVFRDIDHQLDWWEIGKTLGTVLLALLIIPAVNLAGMISSQMEKRLPETGIRKAFGASRRELMRQILAENFMLTLIGGAVGLVISYAVCYFSKNWILNLFDGRSSLPHENVKVFLTADMVFNPTIFMIVLGVCFLLNLLSAIIPAHYGLKKNIVYSLNHNK